MWLRCVLFIYLRTGGCDGRGWGGVLVKDEIRNFQNKLLDVCAAQALREKDAPGQNGEMSQGHFLKVEKLERLL